MTRAHRAGLAALAAVALAAAPAGAGDPPKKKIVIKLGTVAPEGTPWAKQIQKLRRNIHKETGGRVKIKVYTGFAKGGEKAIVRRCVQGSLQMCGVTTGAVATVAGDLAVLELPYLFADSAEADRILDGPALPVVKQILAAKGLVFYGWSENGWRGFGTRKKPIRKLEDLKGMQMRAQESRVHVETYKALGARPVPISLPEVLGALEKGVVDGYDNTPLYLFAASWYQYTKYFTRSAHIYQPAVIAYNKAFFDKLPADIKKVLLAHSEEITRYGRRLIRRMSGPLLDNLRSAGIKVIDLAPAERARFARATRKVHGKIVRRLGPLGKRLLKVIVRAKKGGGGKKGGR